MAVSLADGVGGQDTAKLPRALTVETLLAECAKTRSRRESPDAAPACVQTANTKRVRGGHGGHGLHGGGLSLRFDRATIAHVGDSRCYLIRNGRPQLLTRDHTVLNEQVRLGIFTGQEARKASARNVLSRSIGINLFVASR